MPESTGGGRAFERFVSLLKRMSPADPQAVSRIVQAAMADEAGSVARSRRAWRSWLVRPRAFTVRAVVGLATAATLAGLVLGHALDTALRGGAGGNASAMNAPSPGMEPLLVPLVLQEVSEIGDASERPVPVQFVLVAPAARTVALVGDFNGWDPRAAPLMRDVAGIWSSTVTLPSGRHAYAFIVDDTVWTPDPRVPRSDDVDFGRPNSVVVVGGI